MKLIALVILFLLLLSEGYSQEKVTKQKVDVQSILKNISEPKFRNHTINIGTSDIKKGEVNDFINKKIEECSNVGGGKVVLSRGEYFCNGPVVMQSNVNLNLEEGARLLFSQNPQDYLPVVFVRWEGTEAYNFSPFIYARDVENIAITGKGIIDGNGLAEKSFRDWRDKQKKDQNKIREMGRDGVPVKDRVFGEGHFLRPQLIHFLNCKNILLEDITVTNASFWVIQPTYCDDITIRGITVESRFINNDGVDVDSDTNVLIEDCLFNTGDDFIAIKSGRDQDAWRVNKPSKNIVVRNCRSDECLHGISFGSEISGGAENVYAENLQFKKIREYGLQFKSNKDRGGYIRNIVLNGIQIESTNTCISFTNQYHSYSGGNSPTTFENIRIENLDCKEAKTKAISIVGLPEMPITNVELENVTIHKSGEMSEITNVKNMDWSNINF